MDISRFRQLALAATPGPWIAMLPPGASREDHGYRAITQPWRHGDPHGVYARARNMSQPGKGFVWGDDSAHIAAFNPQAALALLAVVEAAKAVAYSNGFDAALPEKRDILSAALRALEKLP